MDSESESSELVTAQSRFSDSTLLEVESIETDSVASLSDFEDDNNVTYDETTGDLVITVETKESEEIPPSNIPDTLPIWTQEQIADKEHTSIVRDDVAEIRKLLDQCEKISSESESSSTRYLQRNVRWIDTVLIQSESEWSVDSADGNNNKPAVKTGLEYENVSSEEDSPLYEDISEGSLDQGCTSKTPTVDPRNSPCPVQGCDFLGRKLKFHVQHMHIPRVMWDNPQPPVREDKQDELNDLRAQVLLYLSECLTGNRSVHDLVDWINKKTRPLIPRRSQILPRARIQMDNLSTFMKWDQPPMYRLVPVNCPSVLIHWRYQAMLSQYLINEQLQFYLRFGVAFMSNINNLTKSRYEYAQTYSFIARVLAVADAVHGDIEADSDCETNDIRIVVHGQITDEESAPPAKRGKPDPESAIPPVAERAFTVYDAYDTHFHLDRASRKISGDTSVTIDQWLCQQMERPPYIPVNLRGGLLIYCDPKSYPEVIPLDPKWKLAVGLHPKKVATATQKDFEKFFGLVTHPRVSAIGEIGLDQSRGTDLREQEKFLIEVTNWMKPQVPVVLHIRSSRSDHYSKRLYQHALEILKPRCNPAQKFILHCFTGDQNTVFNWRSTFSNTFFGFTHLITSFDQVQLSALRQIPVDRLLCETDSPYLPPQDIRLNSPIYVGEVMEKLATFRYTSIDNISRITTQNALGLFER